MKRCISHWLVSLAIAVSCGSTNLLAGEKTFTLGGATVSLTEVTPDVGVYYTSMRFNRALRLWNVEVSLSNRTDQVMNGPVVLLVDGFAGTTGPLQPDGRDESAKAYYDLSDTVATGRLVPGLRSGTHTLSLGFTNGSPSLVGRVFVKPAVPPFALGLARTLDEAGQPLPNVQVLESGPAGSRTNYSDPVFGLVTLGQGVGVHIWQFTAPGYLPVWRQQMLASNQVTVIPDPRLVNRATSSFLLTPIGGGQVTNSSGTIQINFGPGAVTQDTAATLTALNGQTLQGFLPLGWSPLQSFCLELANEPAQPGTCVLILDGPVGSGETAALVRWNVATLRWDVVQVQSGHGSASLSVSLAGSGTYSVVVGDLGPTVPPAPQVGQPLAPGIASSIDPAGLNASGAVVPSSSPASPVAELVTATATVVITNPVGVLPSGLLLRGEVHEQYGLRDSQAGLPPAALGLTRHPPQYESFMVGYQRPGDSNAATVQASFPLRPLLLFGGEELDQATVSMDVITPVPFGGSVLDTNGGLVASGGVRVIAGQGDLGSQQAAQLRQLDPTNFTDFVTNGLNVVAAFELSVSGVNPGRHLVAQAAAVPTNGQFVLARVLYNAGLYGLQPMERLTSDTQGRLASVEPLSGERLGGLNGAGQYLVLQLNGPEALVSGIARNSGGQVTSGLPVQISGQPWLAFSGLNGAFQLLAPAGAVSVTVTDLSSGDTGRANVTISNVQTTVSVNVAAVATAPYVVSVSPTNGATVVPRVSPIVVSFSEPLNPASLLGGGLQLLGSNGIPVTASLSLNLRNTTATLLPTDPLAPSTLHTLALSTNISSLSGLHLQGNNVFTFTTESDLLNRAGAQFTIYEPTNGFVPVFGSPGAADPESPVILVNQTSGQTATILSRADGSFTNVIIGEVDDIITAILVNRNGTRTELPASRQVFRDGSVGLFSGGGVLEAPGENGPVQVSVDPGTIASRTIYKLQAVTQAQVLNVLQGLMPTNGEVFLGGFTLSQTGDDPSFSPHIKFPIDPARLGLPPTNRPEDASFALVVPVQTDEGDTVYMIVDKMDYEAGALVTHSFTGPRLKDILKLLRSSKKLSLSTTILHALGLPGLQETVLHQLMLPIMIAQGRSLGITGHTLSQALDAQGAPIEGTLRAEGGAVVTGSRGAVEDRQGHLRTGDLFVTSDQSGLYLLLFPVNRLTGDAFVLTATHPAFPGSLATENVTLGNLAQFEFVLTADLIFPRVALDLSTGPDLTPPNITIISEPRDPIPGTNVAAGATVTVAGIDDQAMATLTLVVDTSKLAELNPGLTNLPQVVLTPIAGSQTNTGPHGQQQSFRLICDKRATVKLDATGTDTSGNVRNSSTLILFAGDHIFPININDTNAPRVIATWPPDGATGVAPGTPVEVYFSEAMDPTNLANVSQWLSVSGGGQLSSVEPAPDNKSVLIYFSGTAGQPVNFTINQNLTDRAGNAFDQEPGPGHPGNQSKTWSLTLVAPAVLNLQEVSFGNGCLAQGRYLFVLDRSPGGGNDSGAVLIYDLGGATPFKAAEISLAGPARDLALMPNYAYRLHDGGPVVTNDLLAVVGGPISAVTPFQFLRVYNISDPVNPVRIGSASISLAIATVSKLQWAPPDLIYLESGADATSIGGINLQSFLIGMNATPAEIAVFPEAGRPGVDLNGDGDYVDPGETIPLPEHNPVAFFGKDFSVVAETPTRNTTQRILDFDYDEESGLFGMTLSGGFVRGTNGLPTSTPVLPAYRTISTRAGLLDPDAATFGFTNHPDARPKRVALFGDVRLGVTNVIVRNLAIVSLADISPSKLAVIDITEPLQPKLLKEVDLTGLGIPQTLTHRGDGLLVLATSDNEYLIDPAKLLQDPLPGGQLPFIVGTLEGAGSGANSFASDLDGVNAVNLGSKHNVLLTAPGFRFITLTNQPPITSSNLASFSTDQQLALLATARTEALLTRTKFFTNGPGTNISLAAPNPNTHYYVRVDALGYLGRVLPLVAESLNNAGQPLARPGPFNPPVRLAPEPTLTALGDTNSSALGFPRSFKAFRMSDRPGSPLYNVYLAGPFALSSAVLSSNQVSQLENQLERAVLQPGRLLWVGLDRSAPSIPYPAGILSSIANRRLIPGASGFASVDTPRLPLIVVPGVAGSVLNLLGTVFDREVWPGLLDSEKVNLTLNPSETQQHIVASDILRSAPTPYLARIKYTPLLTCFEAPVYEPLLEYLRNQVGLREYDYVKFTTGLLDFLPCVFGASGHAADPDDMANARTLAHYDDQQIANEPNLFVFAYDWRRSNVTAVAQLKEYVAVVKVFHPEADQVDILAHSMGGLVARRFILDNPGVVRKLVTLGSPWLGAPKAINAMETGDFLDFIQHLLVISKSTLKRLAEFFPGPQELLPSQNYFNLAGPPFIDLAGDLTNNSTGAALSYPQFKQLMDDIYHPDPRVAPVAVSGAFHDYTVQNQGQQDNWTNDNTGVEYFHIVGIQSAPETIGTVSSVLRIRPSIQDPHNLYEIKREFAMGYTTGDHTVPEVSSTRIGGGTDLNAPGYHLYRIVSPGPDDDKLSDHNGMLANQRLLDLVGRILDGDVPESDVATNQSGVVTHLVRIVNADGNTVTASSTTHPGISTTNAPIVNDTQDTNVIVSISHEEDVPGLRVAAPDTNVVDTVAEGGCEVIAGFDGRPMSVRIEALLDGVPQMIYVWGSIGEADFPAAVPGSRTPGGEEIDATIGANIHDAPTLILRHNGSQSTVPPSFAGPPDNGPARLDFYFTNDCREVFFFRADNPTLPLDEIWVGPPVTNVLYQAFTNNPIQVRLLAPLAISNQVVVVAETGNEDPIPPLTLDLPFRIGARLVEDVIGQVHIQFGLTNAADQPVAGRILLLPQGVGSIVETNDVIIPTPPPAFAGATNFIAEGRVTNVLAGGQQVVVENCNGPLLLTISLADLYRDGGVRPTNNFEGGTIALLNQDRNVDTGARLRAKAFAQLVRPVVEELGNVLPGIIPVLEFFGSANVNVVTDQQAFDAGLRTDGSTNSKCCIFDPTNCCSSNSVTCVLPLIPVDDCFNPGRFIRTGPNAGKIYLNMQVFEDFRLNQPVPIPQHPPNPPEMDALILMKVEVFHEMNARLFRDGLIRGQTALNGAVEQNIMVDCATRQFHAVFQQNYGIWAPQFEAICRLMGF